MNKFKITKELIARSEPCSLERCLLTNAFLDILPEGSKVQVDYEVGNPKRWFVRVIRPPHPIAKIVLSQELGILARVWDITIDPKEFAYKYLDKEFDYPPELLSLVEGA